MTKKPPTKAEREHMDRVAAQGCIVCANLGYPDSPAEIHHIKYQNTGIGRRATHYETIPLCPIHHRFGGSGVAVEMGRGVWEQRFGSQRDLLDQVREQLGITEP